MRRGNGVSVSKATRSKIVDYVQNRGAASGSGAFWEVFVYEDINIGFLHQTAASRKRTLRTCTMSLNYDSKIENLAGRVSFFFFYISLISVLRVSERGGEKMQCDQ